MIDRTKLPFDDLTEHEKLIVVRSELSGKRYVPKTDEEGFALVRDLLGEKLFRGFTAARLEVAARYRCSPRWGVCSGWKLFYRFECGGYLCGICIDERRYALRIRLDRRACAAFERLRDTFSRDTVQWAYDFAPVHGGGRYILLDPEHCGLGLRPRALTAAPVLPCKNIEYVLWLTKEDADGADCAAIAASAV